jgi:hypothetical protein
MRSEGLLLLGIGACIGTIVLAVSYQNYKTPEGEVLYTITGVRQAMTRCIKGSGRYVSIKTKFNAPVGSPRHPVSWTVKCYQNEGWSKVKLGE